MNIYDEFITVNSPDKIVDYFRGEETNSKIDYYKGLMHARQNIPKLTKYSDKVYNFIAKIVDFKAEYLFGKGVEFENLKSEKTEQYEKFIESWEQAKLRSHYVKLATSLFAYGESAEIITKTEKGVSHIPLEKHKDEFFAYFDNDGTLGAFSRYFDVKELKSNEIIDISFCQIYTQEYKYTFANRDGWVLESDPESILKMPVVYYSAKSVVERIKAQQDGYNELANELSDVNSQVAYPHYVMKGPAQNITLDGEDIENTPIQERNQKFGDKINTGAVKFISLDSDEDTDFKIVSWNAEPKTLMFELENLKSLMYKFSSVPDISLENLKSLTNISGFALQILFLDADIAKSSDFAKFFELKRAINLHKIYGNFDVDVKAITKSFLPKDQQELVSSLATATMSGTMSQATAVSKNPFVTNPQTEMELIEEEKETSINDITGESYE